MKRAALVSALALTAVTAPAATTFIQGYLRYEYYPNVAGTGRTDVEAAILAGTNAPSTGGTVQGSDKGGLVGSFESGTNFAENYVNRIDGVFIPPVTGNYVFFVAADDDTDLFLSTNEDPANKQLIAQETGWSGVRSWLSVGGGTLGSKRSDQFAGSTWPGEVSANTITLTNGQKYYIEAIHHEGGGGDNLAVIYKMEGDPDPANGTQPNLRGSVIGVNSATAPVGGTVTITTQPVGGSVYVGGSYTLSVAATTTSPYAIQYQWKKDGTPIPGANGTTYIVPPRASSAGSYTVDLTVPSATGAPATVTSTAAVITVPDSILVPGFLKYEYFAGATDKTPYLATGFGTPTTTGGTIGTTRSGFINIMESQNDYADNYVNRISGYFNPPETGNYIFLIAADDDSNLYLSTDDNPANKKLIATEAGWSGLRNYNTIGGGSTVEGKRSDLFTGTQWPGADPVNGVLATITLTNGNRYYIEAVHHEGGGGDRIGVTYRLDTEDESLTANGTLPRITGNLISSYVPPQTITIGTQPASTTVYAGTPARLSVTATTAGPAQGGGNVLFPILYQWRRNGTNIPNATAARYSFVTTSPEDNGSTFDVVMNVPGGSGTLFVTSTVATVTVNAANLSLIVTNKLKRELFNGLDRPRVENGDVGTPSSVIELSEWQSPINVADNYAQRVSGHFIPAVNGNYVFFIAADDDTDLFLSTDDKPANKRLIAQETGWSGVRVWTGVGGGTASQKRSDTWSPDGGTTMPWADGIPLVAGTHYYIEGVHHEGGGGDNMGVTFKLVGENDPIIPATDVVPDESRFTNGVIAYVTKPVTTGSITTQPVSTNTYEAQSITLSVTVTTDAEFTPTYQWRKNGTPIAGATGRTYTIGFLALTDTGNYDVVVNIPNFAGNPITSQAAVVNVLAAPLIKGLLKYDYFPNQTRPAVNAGTAGTASTAGYWVGADLSGYITIGEAANGFADNYANRISGYFLPPETGDYVFYICGDDDVDLFLSTDSTPANKKLIAQEVSWSNMRSWNNPGGGTSTAAAKRSDQFVGTQWPGADTANGVMATITLTNGQLYYIEGVHHEGGGGDNFGITYNMVGQDEPLNLSASRLKGDNIGVKIVPPLGTTAPTISSLYSTTNRLFITYSAPMDPASTTNKANYTITPAAGITVDSVSIREVLEGTKVVSVATLNVTGMLPNTVYTIGVANVKDNNNNVIAAGTAPKTTTPQISADFNNAGDVSPWTGFLAGGNGQIAAGIGPDGSDVFQFTDSAGSQQGALRIDGQAVNPTTNFTAIFKLYIGNGSGDAADGMSFNFGDIPTSVTSVGEEGTGTISVDFDTYNNGGTGPQGRPEGPSFDVKLNGTMIGWAPLTKAAIINDQWVDVIIALNGDNSITAVYNGVTYFNHLSLNNPTNVLNGAAVTGYTPVANGSFMIGARTGGEWARHAMDDLSIVINSGTDVVVSAPKLFITTTATEYVITWTGGGELFSSPDLVNGGTFTTTGDTDGEFRVSRTAAGPRFFKVKKTTTP